MSLPRGVAVAIGLLLVAGCTVSGPEEVDATYCVPRVWVTPAVVGPGDTISVEVESGCDVSTPRDGWVVIAAPVGQLDRAVRTTVDAELEDGFTVTFDVPEDFPPGEGFAGLEEWDFSGCPDDASCASPTGGFEVRRP